jgi:hypothetical protein
MTLRESFSSRDSVLIHQRSAHKIERPNSLNMIRPHMAKPKSLELKF